MRSDSAVKTILVVACLVVILAGMHVAGSFALPVLTALFLAVISSPMVRFLERRARMPSPIAILVTLLLDMGLLAGFIALLVSSFDGFTEALPRYQQALAKVAADATETLRGYGLVLRDDGIDGLGGPGRLMGMAEGLVHEATQLVSNGVLVILLLAFMLFETGSAREKLGVLLGRANPTFEKFAHAAAGLQRYLVVKTVLSVLTGVLSGCWFAACGVDFPLLWGLLTFLLNYIPSVGPAISLVPPMVVALLVQGPGGAAMAAAGHLSIGFVIGSVLEPRMLGQTLGLSTLVVFLSMMFWGFLWGPVGALFAVPLTMLIRSALESMEDTRWAAALLGSHEYVEQKRREWGWTTPEERAREHAPPPPPAESAVVAAPTPREIERESPAE